MIDASIPLAASQGGQVNLVQLMQQAQDYKLRQAQAEQAQMQTQQQQERRGALVDLMRGAQGGQLPTSGPAWDRYRDADPEGAFEMLKGLDADRRKQVEEGVKDLSSAVQWADTPDKWAQVQAHYAQYDPQLAAVPFADRQSALIRLGQMGEYLKATQPKIMGIEAGGSLAVVDPRTGQPTFTVLPNPGDQQPGASAGGGVQEGATATNPQTGQKIQFRGGKWVPAGGQPAGSGPFVP